MSNQRQSQVAIHELFKHHLSHFLMQCLQTGLQLPIEISFIEHKIQFLAQALPQVHLAFLKARNKVHCSFFPLLLDSYLSNQRLQQVSNVCHCPINGFHCVFRWIFGPLPHLEYFLAGEFVGLAEDKQAILLVDGDRSKGLTVLLLDTLTLHARVPDEEDHLVRVLCHFLADLSESESTLAGHSWLCFAKRAQTISFGANLAMLLLFLASQLHKWVGSMQYLSNSWSVA